MIMHEICTPWSQTLFFQMLPHVKVVQRCLRLFRIYIMLLLVITAFIELKNWVSKFNSLYSLRQQYDVVQWMFHVGNICKTYITLVKSHNWNILTIFIFILWKFTSLGDSLGDMEVYLEFLGSQQISGHIKNSNVL